MPGKPPKPWRVVVYTPDADPFPVDYTSEDKAYGKVRETVGLLKVGRSTVTKLWIKHWENGRWRSYEILEGDELR